MNTFHQNGARIDDDLNDLFTRSVRAQLISEYIITDHVYHLVDITILHKQQDR
jgi:hypothetical protein